MYRLRRSAPFVALVMAGVYLLGGLSLIPSPRLLLKVVSSAESQLTGAEPYPCQHCPCGCLTAEQCWSSCCCHTVEERLAFARKHGLWHRVRELEGAASDRSAGHEPLHSCLTAVNEPPPTINLMSALGCKGLRLMLLFAAPPVLAFGMPAPVPTLEASHPLLSVRVERMLTIEPPDVPSPPPR